MKKRMYLLLALTLALVLCACGEGETTGAKTETTAPIENETTAPVEDETTAPVEDETTAPVEDETTAPIEDETTAPEPTEPEPTEPEPTDPPVHNHSFGEWEVVTEASCTEKGLKRRVCECGEKEIEEIPLIDHDYNEQQLCTMCKEHKFLRFRLNGNGESYSVTGCDSSAGTIVIPDTYKGLPVTSIGDSAFSDCSLTSVVIPDGVTSIGNYAFNDCHLTSIVIPDSVTGIGKGAFHFCGMLMNVTFGENSQLTSIGDYVFHGCSLTSIVIPDSVTSIGENAFALCDSLTSITIGSGVVSIGEDAFACCDSLTDIYFNGTAKQWQAIEKGANWNMERDDCKIHFTANMTDGYEIGNYCPEFTLSLIGSDETISLSQFEGKVVVINFWANWCTPCRNELPEFDQLAADYADDVAIIAISTDSLKLSSSYTDSYIQSQMSACQKFIEDKGLTNIYAAFDGESAISGSSAYATLGHSSNVQPITLVLDREGKIIFFTTGSLTYEKLLNAITPVL